MENTSNSLRKSTTGSIVVEYSVKQRCFHVDSLERSLQMNQSAVLEGKNAGYVPIAVVNTDDEANAVVARFRKILNP